PKSSVIESIFPRFQATSIACLIARSTREAVVEYLLAISGYKIFVIDPNNSISLYTIVIASLRYIYPLICAGTPISCIIDVILVSILCSFFVVLVVLVFFPFLFFFGLLIMFILRCWRYFRCCFSFNMFCCSIYFSYFVRKVIEIKRFQNKIRSSVFYSLPHDVFLSTSS